jgi:hypothetical protein
VHNVDNSRGGATLRIPIAAAAVATNFTFRDIDSNPLNNWTASRVGNQIVFAAAANNALNWNTIYNFGFNANIASVDDRVGLDAALPGPGSSLVEVAAKTPGVANFAQVSTVGTGCGNTPGCAPSFYELAFDLANSGWTIANNAGTYRLGTLTGTWIAPTGASLGLTDDSGSLQTLPFTLPHRGGTTNQLWICSNGFVSVAGSSTTYNPDPSAFLAGPATWAPLWHDLNPGAGGTVTYEANAQRAIVSYNAVNNYNLTTTVTFQLQFWANGTVHCIYQNVAQGGNGYLVGYTVGGNAQDPGAIDISATLPLGYVLCNPSQLPTPAMALNASARPVIGSSFTFDTTRMPAGTLLGLNILSQTQYAPGLDLASLGMPTCTLYVGLDVITTFATPGASASVPYSLPAVPALSGVVLLAQTATISPGLNSFGFITSNALRMVLGLD